MQLFGYSILKLKDIEQPKIDDNQKSFVPKNTDDGSAIIAASGSMGAYVDLDSTMRSEAELVNRYRAMALTPEVDRAIQEIVNEAICVDEKDVVKLDLDDLEGMATDPIKEAIEECFNEILELLEFNEKGYYIFQRWYVDGRLSYHEVIDQTKVEDGIQELRYIDPRKIRKIREVETVNEPGPNGLLIPIKKTKAEYYMYNEGGFTSPTNQQFTSPTSSVQGIKIALDSVAMVNSGVTDESGTQVLSYLSKAIKPLNVLRSIEDAAVIYRLARAAERRVWYIDVGNLPKAAAEQYVQSIMDKQKNQVTFNTTDGTYVDKRKFQTMLEDFYLPRREGSRGTEVQTLPASMNLSQIDDIEYFQKKLYNSLSVPISRLQPGDAFTIGRATEITRDEVSFGKFIVRLRTRFSGLFTQLLEKQLVLKQVMSIEDFQKLAPKIKYTYANDNYFMEMKESEVNQNRFELLQMIEPYIGRYYSNKWVNQNILRLNDKEVEEMRKEILEEENDPIYSQPLPGQQMGMDPMMANMGPNELPMDPNNPMDPNGDPNSPNGPPMRAADQADNGGQPPPKGSAGAPGIAPKVQQRRDFKKKERPQVAKN